MGINISNNYPTKQLQGDFKKLMQQNVKSEAEKARQELEGYYNSLGDYSEPSMENICNLYNTGHKTESEKFHKEHMRLCKLYREAALKFGQVLKNLANSTVEDIRNAMAEVKNATTEAITGLQNLIIAERALIK